MMRVYERGCVCVVCVPAQELFGEIVHVGVCVRVCVGGGKDSLYVCAWV